MPVIMYPDDRGSLMLAPWSETNPSTAARYTPENDHDPRSSSPVVIQASPANSQALTEQTALAYG